MTLAVVMAIASFVALPMPAHAQAAGGDASKTGLPAEAAPSSQSGRRTGLIDEVGKWLDDAAGKLVPKPPPGETAPPSENQPPAASPKAGADDAKSAPAAAPERGSRSGRGTPKESLGAADPKTAATPAPKTAAPPAPAATDKPEPATSEKGLLPKLPDLLPASRVVTGRALCVIAANGAPDCKAAAETLCKTKNFRTGLGMETESAETCPPHLLLEGRPPRPGECKTETFVTRAVCQ